MALRRKRGRPTVAEGLDPRLDSAPSDHTGVGVPPAPSAPAASRATIATSDVRAFVRRAARAIERHQARLTRLDAVLGDGDRFTSPAGYDVDKPQRASEDAEHRKFATPGIDSEQQ